MNRCIPNLDLGARELRDERVDVLGARERRAEEVPGGVGRRVAVVALVPVRLQDDHRPVEEVVHHLREEEKNNTGWGHLLADLGWFDLDLECSTILLGK